MRDLVLWGVFGQALFVCPLEGKQHKVTGGHGHFPLSPAVERSSAGPALRCLGQGLAWLGEGWVFQQPCSIPQGSPLHMGTLGQPAEGASLLPEMEWRWRQVDGGGHPMWPSPTERSDGPVSKQARHTHSNFSFANSFSLFDLHEAC